MVSVMVYRMYNMRKDDAESKVYYYCMVIPYTPIFVMGAVIYPCMASVDPTWDE